MRRTPVIVSLVLAFSLTSVGVANALHFHTIFDEWEHGLGEGGNNNYYVHPTNTNIKDHVHRNYVAIYKVSNLLADKTCECKHNHYNWDTTPNLECKYNSRHEAWGNHGFNRHRHNHHNYCG